MLTLSHKIAGTNQPKPLSLADLHSDISTALTSGSVKVIADTVFQHPVLRERLINKVLAVVDDECSALCSRAQPTPFRSCKISELTSFSWSQYIHEMEKKSPILLQMLTKIASHSDHRNETKRADRHYPGICMSAAVLLKERNREIVGVQTHLSLALFSSRVHEDVS